MEKWRDVVGYEGIYEVSDLGNVRTKEGKTTYTEKHGVRKWKSRILKQKVCKSNTCRVNLWKDGKEKTLLVHRLVAEAFIEKEEGKEFVNHIDGSRLNNKVENLEWCTHTENMNHAFDNDLSSTNKKVVLVDKLTKECHYFRSMSKASLFLGKNEKYLNCIITRGKKDLDDFEIFMSL